MLHGHERRHLGWRFVDVLTPAAEMVFKLNSTVPKLDVRFPELRFNVTMRHLTGRAAIIDGFGVFGASNSYKVADAYQPILRGRHRALARAVVSAGRGIHSSHAVAAEAQRLALEGFIRGSCKEWRTFGLDGVELDGKAMDSLARQAVDVEWVDYREPRWVEGDSDPRQMPIIGRWPRHEAFFL